jgi:hypothetical protein
MPLLQTFGNATARAFGFTRGASGPSNALELISTAYGNGSSGTITFSSIPANYSHLQVRWVGVITANSNTAMFMQMNGVSTSSYVGHVLYAGGSGPASTYLAASTAFQLNNQTAGMSTLPAVGIVDILDYLNTSKNKTMRSFSGIAYNAGNSKEVSLNSGVFLSTSAISSLTFTAGGGIFATSARISLYGVKG